jgi:hypothetical protein
MDNRYNTQKMKKATKMTSTNAPGLNNLYRLIVFLMVFMVFLPLINASAIPPQKQGTSVILYQTPTNATFCNITSIIIGNNQILQNQNMTIQSPFYFIYNFTDITQLGTYVVTTLCDDNSILTTNSYDFLVNGSGQEVTSQQTTMMIIGIVVLLIMAGFFFTLSIMFRHPGTKIFLMALASLTMIVIIGILTSNASVYLAEFPNFVNIYNNYYVFMTIGAGVGIAGIVVWLIYYSVTLFSKTRAGYDGDD